MNNFKIYMYVKPQNWWNNNELLICTTNILMDFWYNKVTFSQIL